MRKKEIISGTILDPGGPIWIRENSRKESYFTGLMIDVFACTKPDCPCRDMDITAIDVDERNPPFDQIRNRKAISSALTSRFFSEGAPFRMKLNIDTGEIRAAENQTIGVAEAGMIQRLDRQLREKGLLDTLRNRWRIAKNQDAELYKQKDWSGWEPGNLVAWSEVFPFDYRLLLYREDHAVFIEEQYCVTPGCNCREAALAFATSGPGKTENLGALFIDIGKWRISNAEPLSRSAHELGELFQEFQAQYPDLRKILQEHRRRMRSAMAEVLVPPSLPRRKQTSVPNKMGRNDPCYCGSGKKYKKCCLGKS